MKTEQPRSHSAASTCRWRLHPLVACIALASSTNVATASVEPPVQNPLAAVHLRRVGHPILKPAAVPSAITRLVSTCDDPLPVPANCADSVEGTLRRAVLCAQNNDSIDLTQLTCSTITLSAPLTIGPLSLTLAGPGQDKLTIDAGAKFRALVHNAGKSFDTLYVSDLTIANGRYDSAQEFPGSYGGCIYSSGRVVIDYSAITSCYVSSSASIAAGGAIFARGTASLYHSSVTGSTAYGSSNVSAFAGGIYATNIDLHHSTVSGNMAEAPRSAYGGGGYGGGVLALQTVFADYSTVSGNMARTAGGILGYRVYLYDSTVSGNQAASDGVVGGIYAGVGKLFNCTVAGNTGGSTGVRTTAAGFFSTASSILQNTIVANNKTNGIELDVDTLNHGTVGGHNNLIVAHGAGTMVPADTISSVPLLGPLQDNGGPTRTHALLPGSPAIDAGGATELVFDQRGSPRVIGSRADIGAVEFDPEHIFCNGFNL